MAAVGATAGRSLRRRGSPPALRATSRTPLCGHAALALRERELLLRRQHQRCRPAIAK